MQVCYRFVTDGIQTAVFSLHPQHSIPLTFQGSTLALVVRHGGLWKTTESCFLALFFPFSCFLLMQMHLLHLLFYLSLLGSLFAFYPCLGKDNGPRLGM